MDQHLTMAGVLINQCDFPGVCLCKGSSSALPSFSLSLSLLSLALALAPPLALTLSVLCVWVFCRHVYLHVCAWCSSVQKMLDPLEMELHVVVRCWWAVNPCPLGEQQVLLTARPHPIPFLLFCFLSPPPPPRETITLSALVAAPVHSH